MGLDITIKTASDQPLGSADEVKQVLTQVFLGIRIGVSSSGREKLDYAAKNGIEFPAVIRENMLSQPAKNGAEFDGDGYSLQMHWPIQDPVATIDAVAYFKGLFEARLCQHLARLPGWRSILHDTGRFVDGTAEGFDDDAHGVGVLI